MTFPLPYSAMHRAYAGTGEDAHGNEIGLYADPVEIACFWWQPLSAEPAAPGHDRVVLERVMVVDSATEIGPHDLIELSGKDFPVTAWPEDYDHGPWWSPGRKPVYLRRIEG